MTKLRCRYGVVKVKVASYSCPEMAMMCRFEIPALDQRVIAVAETLWFV